LPEGGFVFCCFNRYYKLNPRLFDIWMKVLHGVDGSVLWLSAGNATAMSNLRNEAARRGVDPDRLVFAGWLADPEEHVSRYQLADLFLDTLPFNAHTTASDALWAGLPVLTCEGSSYAGRVSASLLRAVGCPELIMGDLQQYQIRAVEIAQSAPLASSLRSRIEARRQTTSLFDTGRYCRELESLYLNLWERFQSGAPAEHFDLMAGGRRL
jgi:predicted O-linked N-acetylglucosamine transferase (SPINDLY family)